MKKSHRYLFFSALVIAGCVDASGGTGPIDIYDDAGIGMSEDAGTADAGDSGQRTTDAETDSGADMDWLLLPMKCDETGSTVTYPEGPPFEKLHGDIYGGDRFPKASVEPVLSGIQYKLISSLRTNRIRTKGWVINEPHDVGVTIAVFTTKPLGPNTYIDFTALMDYRPVELGWELAASDDSIERTETGSGFRIKFDEQVEVIEATIPFESFAEPGYHEFVFYLNASGPEQYILTSGKRLGIWNQSGSRLPHPCFEPVEASPMTDAETEYGSFDSYYVSTYDADFPGIEHLEQGVRVSPGEELTVNYHVSGGGQFASERFPAAIFPTLNGVPVVPPRLIFTPEAQLMGGDNPLREVVYREQITINAPLEPGEHDFSVGMVRDAFRPETTPDGKQIRSYGFPELSGTKMRIIVEE